MVVVEFWQYNLKDSASEVGFLRASESVQDNYLNKQAGFLAGRRMFKSQDGLWTEVVRWETMEDAKRAHDESKDCRYCNELFSFIDMKNAELQYLEEKQRFDGK